MTNPYRAPLYDSSYECVNYHTCTAWSACTARHKAEKPKVRNGAGLFKYKSTQQYPLHLMIEMKFILATLIYHCHTGRPVPCIAHTTDNLMMARLFSGEDSTFSSLLAYFRKLENDNLLHIINVQRGHPCVKGSRKARMKDYGHFLFA